MTQKNLILRFIQQFSLNRYWFLIVFISLPVWIFFIAPFLLKIPTDFSYKADIISVDNFYDEKIGDYRGEQYSNTKFSYQVVDKKGPVIVIKNTFHVSTPEGKTIFKTEPLYGINSFTGQHVPGYGDRDRDGYLFAPHGLSKDETFSYWHVSNNKSVNMRYEGERLLYGLRVFKFVSDEQGPFDQTEFMHHLPDVPEMRGVKLNNGVNLWIEPVSGYVVKMEDYSREYYFYDIKTGQKLAPYNQFLNTYSEQSVREHVKRASDEKNKFIIVQKVIPSVLILILIFIVIFYNFPHFFIFSPKYLFPILVFVSGVIFTAAVFLYSQNNIEISEQELFRSQSEKIKDDIEDKMNLYINLLSGGKGFFDASVGVERDEWRSYVQSLNIQKSYPGIQGMGFSRVIQPRQKYDFIGSIHKEGYIDFQITPEGERDIYTSIVYLEPFDERNKRAFGYDMFSESVRRKAMMRARDTGLPSLSGKVRLKQETDTDIQNGFLLYVPVYKKNITAESTLSDSIYGYVYAPFRVNDFMDSFLHGIGYDVSFQLFDGLRTDPDKKMYTSAHFPTEKDDLRFREITTLTIAGHPWTLEFVNSSQFKRNIIYLRLSYGILILGFLISMLGFFVLHALMTSRDRAVDYAKKVNKKLINNVKELEISRDNTLIALREAEVQKEKTQKANTRLKLATRSAHIGIWEWDMVNHHLIWDTQMYALYGYKKQEFVGKAQDIWYKSIHPDDKERVNNALQKSIKKKQLFDEKFRIIWPDETIHDIRAFGLVQNDEHGVPVHMVGVNWDITQEALIDRQKTEFVSIASHQLRTPLTAVSWYTEMMLRGDGGVVSPAQKKYLNEIYQSNQVMIDLVSKLLNVSRIELGTLKIESRETDVVGIFRDVVAEQQKNIKTKKLIIRQEFDVLDTQMTDPTLVRIILQNLFANAIKYTSKGGKITCILQKHKDNIVIQVADTGCGIPLSARKEIFHKFFRAENVRDTKGTGLGLYIVKSMVEKLQGGISFETVCVDEKKRGKTAGTTFTVTLPFITKNPLK